MSDAGSSKSRSLVMRLVVGFGHFWWDFLIGDTPEITIAVVVIVGVVAFLRNVVHTNALAYVTLLVLTIATLALSAAKARSSGKTGER